MKKSLLLVSFLLAGYAASAQTVLFSCDFQDDEETATKFAAADYDGNTPTSLMQSIGFSASNPWICLKDYDESTNKFWGSTSMFSPAGTANDWMITNAITIPEDSGYLLEFKAESWNSNDSLKIYISSTGRLENNFPAEPFYKVEESMGATEDFDGEWHQHSISLDEFKGQTVYIAFVNKNTNKSIIAIDDVWVGRYEDISLSLDTEEYVYDQDELEVKGTVTNVSDNKVTSLNIALSYAGNTYNKEITGIELSRDDSYSFTLDQKIALTVSEPVTYNVLVTPNVGTDVRSIKTVEKLPFKADRKVVIEEGTGAWCGNCPLGMWAMENIKENYGDRLIPILIQCNTIGNPIYAASYTYPAFSAFPTGTVNRGDVIGPIATVGNVYSPDNEGGFKSNFISALNETTFIDITPSATYSGITYSVRTDGTYKTTAGKADATVKIKFAKAHSNIDYRVAFVLTEDDVEVTGQANYFKGATSDRGGFESMDNPCTVILDGAARSVSQPTGAASSIPSSVAVNEEITYSESFNLSTYIKDYNKVNLIAMVIDYSTGKIVNANSVTLTEPNWSDFTGIAGVTAETLKVSVEGNKALISTAKAENVTVELFSVNGEMIYSATVAVEGSAAVELPSFNGMAILKVKSADNIVVEKLF